MVKVIRVSLKVRSVYSNPEENSCLNMCVLLRSCCNVFKNLKIPDLFVKFSIAQGRAKVKLRGVC